jgi:predicted CXXCH cytochrome family protein
MRQLLLSGLACWLFLPGTVVLAEQHSDAQQCLQCHDYGADSPVHALLEGSHGLAGDAEAMAGRKGCQDCHGDSEAHTRAPTRNTPETSFGPRWSASAGDQDGRCLSCHEENVAKNWRHALHMHNNLTCVTCHDIHQDLDKVLDEPRQAEVCTTCHKVQKQGIHGMERRAKRNPPCSTCHNPHDHESAATEMLKNRSAGCLQCHDLARMAQSERVSAKAKSYHKVMTSQERTCIDCHQGIAHAPVDSALPLLPSPLTGRDVTLFYPGQTDSHWLTQEHPGSQPLRQGAYCQRCHRGEEAELGAALGDDLSAITARTVNLSFATDDSELIIRLQWQGSELDETVALMWGDSRHQAFGRGGCFAACHNDMPGMSADRGRVSDKYLQISRAQQQQLGMPAIVKDQPALDQLMAQGQFVELWQANLKTGEIETTTILEKAHRQKENLTGIKAHYENGTWTLELNRELTTLYSGINFSAGESYTLGIALISADHQGKEHLVSLPMTLSFGGNDTDFSAE